MTREEMGVSDPPDIGSIHAAARTIGVDTSQENNLGLPEPAFLPAAYHLPEGSIRGPAADQEPQVVFIRPGTTSTKRPTWPGWPMS